MELPPELMDLDEQLPNVPPAAGGPGPSQLHHQQQAPATSAHLPASSLGTFGGASAGWEGFGGDSTYSHSGGAGQSLHALCASVVAAVHCCKSPPMLAPPA